MRGMDLSNKRFGRQVAIKPCGVNKFGNVLWECRCDCGNFHLVSQHDLVQGRSKSCGCLARDLHIKQLEKHGITTGGKPRIFNIWSGMKSRCLKKNSIQYKDYGGRGITICKEWLEFEAFHKWAMENGYTDKLSIDRIDNDGNYCPENCRFATVAEQARNKRNNHFLIVNGIKAVVVDWIKAIGCSKSTMYSWIRQGGDSYAIQKIKERLSA